MNDEKARNPGKAEGRTGRAVGIALLAVGAAAVMWFIFFGPGFCCLPAER